MRRWMVLLILVVFPWVGLAAEKPVWLEAEGEARLGDFDTLKEVKDRARRDAEAKAIEQAVGVFIRSHTLISNSQVAEDLIYAAVRGKITKEIVVSSDWDHQDRHLYRTRINALVEPVYPEKGDGLSVNLSLSKTDLKEGEETRIFYRANKDAYIYIFSIAADGSVTLLLPNSQIPDHFVRGGKACEFPPADSPIRLKALFLPGFQSASAEERIKIIATRNNEELLPLGFREGIFHAYDARSTGMISDLVRRLNQFEPTDWAEATAVYTLTR